MYMSKANIRMAVTLVAAEHLLPLTFACENQHELINIAVYVCSVWVPCVAIPTSGQLSGLGLT